MKPAQSRSRRLRALGYFFALCLAALCSANPATASDKDTNDWEFTIAPYLLGASLNGDAAIGRVGAPIDLNFKDVLKNLDFGAMLRLEARKGEWGVIGDLIYAKLGASRSFFAEDRLLLDAGAKIVVGETLVFYRLQSSPTATLDVLAGARIWTVDLNAELTGPIVGGAFASSETWADPVIGIRGTVNLGESWRLSLRGDIGGFGAGSSFSWQILAGIIYDISPSFSLAVQYRYLDVDFSSGTPGQPGFFLFDSAVSGPVIGAAFTF